MKKIISLEFFLNSKRWNSKSKRIKNLSTNTVKIMKPIFNSKYCYNVNIILSDQDEVKKLNKKYKNKNSDTDVLTFINHLNNEEVKKILYCDLFFSIDTIEKFINKNKISFYDHFNHLLVHSFLHVNGFKHSNNKDYQIMKKKEIEILKKIGINNPYIN